MHRIGGQRRGGVSGLAAPRWWVLVSVAAVCLLAGPQPARAAPAHGPSPAQSALVLYDAPAAYAWLGELYAAQVANLLGHFNLAVTRSPVGSYRSGQMGSYRATFYIGSYFGNPLPAAFLSDVKSQKYSVCWMKYNLEQIAWNAQGVPDFTFEQTFGFRFNGLNQSGYDIVRYRGADFTHDLRDPEVGLITVQQPTKVATFATLYRQSTGAAAPYTIRSGTFWYVADIPFSYISETDRYLVFADVLHDIVGINHAAPPRAMVRLEDIDPSMPVSLLRTVTGYLESQGVPYGLSVIPRYTDPLGYYNNGVAETGDLNGSPVQAELLRAAGLGAPVFQHGFTHQYSNIVNPLTAVTGDDFEFFRVTLNLNLTLNYLGSVSEDSGPWARGRERDGRRLLGQAGLTALGWETPHYAGSDADYGAIVGDYPKAWERALYFSSSLSSSALSAARAWGRQAQVFDLRLDRERPRTVEPFGVTAGTSSTGPKAFAGQFFPYVIQKDIYGRALLPENLGHIDPVGFLAFPPRFPSDLLDAARRNLALREPWAVFYFHPFVDVSYLQQVVTGLRAMGYQFVSPAQAYSLVGTSSLSSGGSVRH